MMKIGILGLAVRKPQSIGGNLGCYALSYSFFEILSKIAKKRNESIEVVMMKPIKRKDLVKWSVKSILRYKDLQLEYYSSKYPNLKFSKGYYYQSGKRTILGRTIRRCNCVFDFTAGDSFTDIYGQDRFYTRTDLKKLISDSGIPLVLGSQTIGPFNDKAVERYASQVMEKCEKVFVRDEQSQKYVEEISKVKPVLTSDVAFFLPYDKNTHNDEKKRVGFNPSGLLWMGGYNGKNQFGLSVDYREYCNSIIKYLIDKGYEVHLVLHAYFVKDKKGIYHSDNDRLAVESLNKLYPATIVSPSFTTPMEAKSYISGMNLFIGARMHATIGAISAGIPVIPFSYSRKFEGLFSSLSYPYIVEGTKWTTEKAVSITKEWINKLPEIHQQVCSCKKLIEEKNKYLLSEYENTIFGIHTRHK